MKCIKSRLYNVIYRDGSKPINGDAIKIEVNRLTLTKIGFTEWVVVMRSMGVRDRFMFDYNSNMVNKLGLPII